MSKQDIRAMEEIIAGLEARISTLREQIIPELEGEVRALRVHLSHIRAHEQTTVRDRILLWMCDEQGVSEREVRERLGWKRAWTTTRRIAKTAPYPVRKVKGADGRQRWIAEV